MLKVTKAVLVYQCGIANVFMVSDINMADIGRDARRLLQGDFRSCEYFARGLAYAGAEVECASCNQAGDILNATWTLGVEHAPFRDHMHPVRMNR